MQAVSNALRHHGCDVHAGPIIICANTQVVGRHVINCFDRFLLCRVVKRNSDGHKAGEKRRDISMRHLLPHQRIALLPVVGKCLLVKRGAGYHGLPCRKRNDATAAAGSKQNNSNGESSHEIEIPHEGQINSFQPSASVTIQVFLTNNSWRRP